MGCIWGSIYLGIRAVFGLGPGLEFGRLFASAPRLRSRLLVLQSQLHSLPAVDSSASNTSQRHSVLRKQADVNSILRVITP